MNGRSLYIYLRVLPIINFPLKVRYQVCCQLEKIKRASLDLDMVDVQSRFIYDKYSHSITLRW